TLYVVSRFIDQAIWLWVDAVRYMVTTARSGSHVIHLAVGPREVHLNGGESREDAWRGLCHACFSLTPPERKQALATFSRDMGVSLPAQPPREFAASTWNDLRSMNPGIVELGSHSCSHPILSRCSDEELETELVQSKETIERQTGRSVKSFCYPNGQPAD